MIPLSPSQRREREMQRHGKDVTIKLCIMLTATVVVIGFVISKSIESWKRAQINPPKVTLPIAPSSIQDHTYRVRYDVILEQVVFEHDPDCPKCLEMRKK